MAPEITTWTVYYLSEYNTSNNVICYNSGSPTTFSTSTVADMYQEIQGSTPTKDGFVFGGWCLESQYNDDVKVDVSNKLFYAIYSDPTSNHTFRFVAIWRSATPTTTFNSNTGAFPTDSSTTKTVQTNLDGTVSLSSLVEFPVKSGYVFRGWSTTENGSVVYTPYATPTITEDTTLYAVWQKAESYLVREDTLVNIANAVRTKTGGTDAIALDDMATMIAASGPTISASGDTLTITN